MEDEGTVAGPSDLPEGFEPSPSPATAAAALPLRPLFDSPDAGAASGSSGSSGRDDGASYGFHMGGAGSNPVARGGAGQRKPRTLVTVSYGRRRRVGGRSRRRDAANGGGNGSSAGAGAGKISDTFGTQQPESSAAGLAASGLVTAPAGAAAITHSSGSASASGGGSGTGADSSGGEERLTAGSSLDECLLEAWQDVVDRDSMDDQEVHCLQGEVRCELHRLYGFPGIFGVLNVCLLVPLEEMRAGAMPACGRGGLANC